jgi:hypothetical protein
MQALTYLDETGIAYLLMIIGFLVMARMNNKAMDENRRLRRLIKNTVLGDNL